MTYYKVKQGTNEWICSDEGIYQLKATNTPFEVICELSQREAQAYKMTFCNANIEDLAFDAYAIALCRLQYKHSTTKEQCFSAITQEFAEMITAKKQSNDKYFIERLLEFARSYNGDPNNFRHFIEQKYCDLYKHYIKDSISDEMADVVLTILSVAIHLNVDISGAIARKKKFNELR